MTADRAGYWEKSGYHNYGNPWEQERYASIEEPQQSAEPFLAPIEPVYPEALQMEDVDFEPQASWLRRVVGRIFPRWQ